MQRNNPVAQEPGESEDEQNQPDGNQGTLQFAMRPFVVLMLTSGNHLAKPYDRMWQLLRVAKDEVEQPADE
jgi:hypothetical protein